MEYMPSKERIQYLKDTYPSGTRILLKKMGNDPCPISPNTKGTVKHVDDSGTIHCVFDNGRELGIIEAYDDFCKTEERVQAPQSFKLPSWMYNAHEELRRNSDGVILLASDDEDWADDAWND